MTMTNMYDHIDSYRKQGFVEIPTDSGTGSIILIDQKKGMVVKFNQDAAYDTFVTFVQANQIPAFPTIIRHEKPLGDFRDLSNSEYTVTEMEQLVPLSDDEQASVVAWIDAALRWLQSGSDLAAMPDDPFDLKSALGCLRSEAIRAGVDLDITKGSNFMKRASNNMARVVVTDPFN